MSTIIRNVVLEFFDTKLDKEEYEFLSDFTFLWGILESKFRLNNKTLDLKRIEHVINSIHFKDNLDNILSLPVNIVIECTKSEFIIAVANIDFRANLFPTERKQEFAYIKTYFGFNTNGIKNIKKSNPEIIFLIFFIAYRLRNNLFHGNKFFQQLYEQKKFFKMINKFLVEILIKTKDINLNDK